MTTANDLIKAACRQLQFEPDANEAADALEALNIMLNLWAIEGGIYQVTRENWSLTASTASYTIGSSQDLDTTLPVDIIRAFIRDSDIDYPIDTYFGVEDYALIEQKSLETRPQALYFDRGYATGTIFLYPTPDSAYDFHLWSKKPLATYSSLSDTLTVPVMMEAAIKYNLAVELAAEFGRDIAPQTALRADQTVSALKRYLKHPVPTLVTNPFSPHGRGKMRVETDDTISGTARVSRDGTYRVVR